MRIGDLQRQMEDLLTRPGEQLSRGARFVRSQIELWRFCARRLRDHNIAAMSAALSFRTIFALVPLLVLAFLFMRSVGMVEDGKQALRQFLDTSGFTQIVAVRDGDEQAESQPTTALADAPPDTQSTGDVVAGGKVINVAEQIEQLVDNVESKLTFQRLGPIGALLLIWTAMTLLTTVETSLNRIFEATVNRSLARRIVLFWTAITLGPILIVAAVYIGRNAIEAAIEMPHIAWLAAPLGWATPGVVGILVVAMGYKLVPSTSVRFDAAFGGALVAVPAWMLARWGFAIYVERFVLKGNLYGVLGAVPLFLLWLNISWTIFLFGAELAHTATSLKQLRFAEFARRAVVGPSDWLAVALAVARPFQRGDRPAALEQLRSATGLPQESVQRIVAALVKAELVIATGDDEACYVPARPLETITVRDIYDLADPRNSVTAASDESLRAAVDQASAPLRAQLQSLDLAMLCRTASPPATECDPPS